LLATKHLIVAGDLNFTVSAGEVWGTKSCLDPLARYFKGIFKDIGLVDIVPKDCLPTWHNGRGGSEAIAKQLHLVCMSEDLIMLVGRHRYWVDYPYISYYALVFLQFYDDLRKVAYPFNINSIWLGEVGFYALVHEV